MVNGNDISEARGRLRWTQQQLADAVGVSRNTIIGWENGGPIRKGNLAHLEQVLGAALIESAQPTDSDPLAHLSDLELIAELNRRAAKRAADEMNRYRADTRDDVAQPLPTDVSSEPGRSGELSPDDINGDGIVGSLERFEPSEGNKKHRGRRASGQH